MRLAWVSPLPPARSGIADYSAELLPAVAEQAEVALFAPPPYGDAPWEPVHPLADLARQAGGFDAVVYHMGNNPYHVDIYDLALRLPGIVVLHDYVLHHLVARCTIAAGDIAGYLWHLAYERGTAGAAMAVRRAHGVFSEREQFLDPLNRVLLARSRGVIVHSRWAAEQVRRACPGLPVRVIPHHLAPLPAGQREAFRRQMGLPPQEILVFSLGFIQPEKRVEQLLQAYAALRPEHPEVRCCLVGEADPAMDLPGILERLGLVGQVTVTGYVEAEAMGGYIAAGDIAVNLRHPSAGETSGALVRLLGSGKAVITSNVCQYAEWPDEVCLKVDVGPAEVPMLQYYLRRLVQDAALRRRLGENARRYVEQHHALEHSAREYLAFCAEVAAGQRTCPR